MIREVGIEWRHSPRSRVRLIADSLLMMRDLFRIRYYHLKQAYKIRKPDSIQP